ncbi:hypothetical protein QEN58_14360 [Halomonas alkaliantarctica]|uniref:Uncharacterized protein n=1 Tax=Halomonas alkaliantarctica TaxID=232346 RepID=A0ABY8LME2_9GAMM|nr:hypothetical protein [Halomonas alkaliantarctica]WGI24504.1 hypothetical protein QEN58_14360 [Halomonas alkaliantarctica]
MDKQHGHIERKQIHNRPRWLTLCMMATAASVIVLAGCGDNEEPAPSADETAPLEQNATTQPEPSMNEELSADEESSMEQDPGLSEDSAAEDTMPQDTMDEPAEGTTMNPDEDEPGFGEGTEPMPGADEDENSTSN